MTDKVSNELLAEMGVDAIARLARMKGPLADASAIASWMHDARNALRNAQSEAVAWRYSADGVNWSVCSSRDQAKYHPFFEPLYTHPAPQSEAVTIADESPEPTQSRALKRIYDKLAKEGGGTWATYMLMEIEGFAALTHPAPPLAVTDEMVEAAAEVLWTPTCDAVLRSTSHTKLRAALTAALGAKQ